MEKRWLNLLFLVLLVIVFGLFYHLFIYAKTSAAASLIINLLKPLNILLFLVLCFVLFRSFWKLYLGQKSRVAGFRLRTKFVLAILPLTLVPSVIIFFLATRFIDDILIGLADTNMAEIVENAEHLRGNYLTDLERLHLGHGPDGLRALATSEAALIAYLEERHIQGAAFFEDNQLGNIWVTSEFPPQHRPRLEKFLLKQPIVPTRYDDGLFLAAFPYCENNQCLFFLYVRETPFTERYAYIQDSYQYLRQTQKKTEKIKGLNQGILLITTLAVIFGGIWLGLAFARRFLQAFNVLGKGAEKISKGDFDTKIELETGDELEDLVSAFNAMTAKLKLNQAEIRSRAHELEALNAQLSDQIQYNLTILQQINAGILSVDQDQVLQTHNPEALKLLGIKELSTAIPLVQLLSAKHHEPLLKLWQSHCERGYHATFSQLEWAHEEDKPTRLAACSIVPLVKDGERFGSLIVIEDLTQLHQAQKLAAWREVAKRVAHEIKNPLTPIQLSIQRIQRKAARGAPDLAKAVDSAHDTIMAETLLLKNLVNEFSTFAKMPAPVKRPVDLGELICEVCQSYAPIHPHLDLVCNVEPAVVLACDPSQIRQVLSNLIANAAQATPDQGAVTVSLHARDRHIELKVTDTGKGIPEAERDKVFMPYYSKSPKGTGLGLAIVKRIVEDHAGTINIAENQPNGTKFTIRLPLPIHEPHLA